MFIGISALTLDGKGRMTVPARHRDVLLAQAAGRLTVTKSPEGCLLLFADPQWQEFRAKIAALPMSAQGWKRIYLGHATETEIDATGRVLISPELRAAAGIERDIDLIGMGSHFEVWDRVTHHAREAAVIEAGMPDAVRDIVV
ncbi:protein MraZ [mine drainage metagenome]|uniref:Transcriptional regulator MraZ n=2 Tax=root TaxID=1 RepID=A0A238D3I3_THIDL|nr:MULTISPECIES: division/cell wall cluster transcriptional repressor MraZ [Thiomonas]MDE2130035.1 division/cell wall cluster transcriptional repressor MraZ [Betaproteobacteria bacterium]OZB44307.1 MAG: cell division/cell wall cluster transcriptional repressor MraZ [Thiomonas sp. 15-66-11]OZB61378.1 MAG: cell division/cell wall cluster transcriptional repressor MraZ [Thiomonas sp. 13-66-29]SBP87734.1 Protein MraZ [Thiomonas delicata]